MRDPTPADAAHIALLRRAVRRSFMAWARHCGYHPASHHQLLIEKLTAVAEGKIPNLAVFMPPGSAKSTYCSILFVPWYLARFQNKSIIAASHTIELAEKWGRKIRNLIVEHGATLGIELAKDSQAAGRWASIRKPGGQAGISRRRRECPASHSPAGKKQARGFFTTDLGPNAKSFG